MTKVIVANRFTQEALTTLQQSGLVSFSTCENISELKSEWSTCEALLIRSGVQITAELLSQMPKLRVITSATSGFDHIDFKTCQAKKISVMHTPNANAQSAAEHTWGLLLATQRNYAKALQQVESGQWLRQAITGHELRGQSLGIIGYGRIGQRVYQMAQAFAMPTLVHDPYVEQKDHPGVSFLGFEEVVRNSDIVTFHVPLTSETKHMIKASTLEWFHEEATLINASRGDIICFSSLLNHLIEHPKFRLGLDVYPAEPLDKTSALLQHPHLFCTPHIGATTYQALQKASREAVQKLIDFIKTGLVTDSVPPQTLWASKLS